MRKKSISNKNKNMIMGHNIPFAIEESYKVARTNLMFSLPGVKCKKIVVTSPRQGEGKSTTTINLALSIAEMGKKVLLIDADLRRSSVAKKLHIREIPGLSNILSGDVSVADCIQEENGLDIIPAGDIPPNPSELLGSDTLKNLVKSLESQYEYIFFDLPPVCTVTDTTMLADVASGAVVIVRDGTTEKNQITEALRNLKLVHMKVLGFIIIGTHESKQAYNATYGEYGR